MTKDYEMIINKDYHGLFEAYKPLMMKYYMKMIKVSSCGYSDYFDFIGDFYEQFVKAFNATKVSKIKDPNTFSFYIQLEFYLRNFTSRKIRDHKKWQKFSYSIPENYDIPIDEDDTHVTMDAFDEVYSSLTDIQRQAVDEVIAGKRVTQLCVPYKDWREICNIFYQQLLNK